MLYQLEFNYKKQPAPETKNLFQAVRTITQRELTMSLTITGTRHTATTMKPWKKPLPAAKLRTLIRLPKANLPPFQTTCRSCWNVSRAVLLKWLKVYLPKERQTTKA